MTDAAARRRSHRLDLEQRARALQSPIDAWLATVLREESRRQLDLVGIPRSVAKDADLPDELAKRLQVILEGAAFRIFSDRGAAEAKALGGPTFALSLDDERKLIQGTVVQVLEFKGEMAAKIDTVVRRILARAAAEFPRPSVDDIRRQIMDEVGTEAAMRPVLAKELAQSFTNSVSNQAIVAAYTQVGVQAHEWVSIVDLRSRDSHGGGGLDHADGKQVMVGTPFVWTGLKGSKVSGMYPGDMSLPAYERRWCRCTTAPVRGWRV